MKFINKLSFVALIGIMFNVLPMLEMGEDVDMVEMFINQIDYKEEDQESDVKTLKELVARALLCKPFNLEELMTKLPKEIIDYMEQIIAEDERSLPFVMKKIRNGSVVARSEIIAQYQSIFDAPNASTILLHYNEEEMGCMVNEGQLFWNMVMDIIKNGTIKEINSTIIVLQQVFNGLLNFARDGNEEMSELAPVSREILSGVISEIKAGHLDLGPFRQMSANLEFQEHANDFIQNTLMRLNLIFDAEKQITYILKNKNINLNCKHKNKTPLGWARKNTNVGMAELLIAAGACDRDIGMRARLGNVLNNRLICIWLIPTCFLLMWYCCGFQI